ncbi:MAG TPA: serine/threonine-protein kinase [Pyrinomonadaceae bacterium]|nr:serine/threonine-protein kinase [Pyrinomonadaceae bacterium]
MSTHDEKTPGAGAHRLAPETILQSRYRVIRHLGSGGMGAVYEAIDLRLGHTVALKQALTSDEGLWKQFEREARLMAALDHPVLPRVSDYFTEGHRAFFVMQFVEGQDLAEIIAQQPGPFPRHAVIAWADQLLDALIYLHSRERQVIHRDIKPHNLKITPTGRIVLLDFGLAKTQIANSADPASSTSVFGYTPRYAPLEQIQDLGTTPQSDIYALGATLYHLLTGVKPPDALARAAALVSARPSPLKPANEVNLAVGSELAAILDRAMAQNPDERYVSATEFREALRRVGRVDGVPEVELVVHHAPIEATVVEIVETGDTTLVASSVRAGATGRLGAHAIALVFVIMLVAFSVFCRYYPWKLPLPEPAEISAHQLPNVSESVIQGARIGSTAARKRRP